MATSNQKKVFDRVAQDIRKGTKVSVSKSMKGVYSPSMTTKPEKLTRSKGWKELMNQHFPEDMLSRIHGEILNATRLDHMVFPPFRTKTPKALKKKGKKSLESDEDEMEDTNVGEDFGEQLTDKEIREMLGSVNCIVRKIVHGDMARHVYFWAADNKSRNDALDKAYKLKGLYAPDKLAIADVTPLTDEEMKKREEEMKKREEEMKRIERIMLG